MDNYHHGESILGYKVREPSEELFKKSDRIIISSRWQDEIAEQLESLGLHENDYIMAGHPWKRGQYNEGDFSQHLNSQTE